MQNVNLKFQPTPPWRSDGTSIQSFKSISVAKVTVRWQSLRARHDGRTLALQDLIDLRVRGFERTLHMSREQQPAYPRAVALPQQECRLRVF
jgi:hypothetical protein